jgi:hypothetical protein
MSENVPNVALRVALTRLAARIAPSPAELAIVREQVRTRLRERIAS